MSKRRSLLFGTLLLSLSLLFLSSSSIAGAVVGLLLLLLSVLLFRYAESSRFTQDEKRGRCNRNRLQ